ncbi:tetratricopeptide repeat protein [cf. Phormidesmis sp. LEGE 11477]|uniref:tetratricopeptide repeat protein n=1 Tax=cf. Phormidesmis sp. LEGE 11477 TaxID=1828680 RepID=UPI0018823F8B|nr:tetratricopeptide repeat protein [cf. Phormidesmis sp. LEGE 11477]MBE9060107.1 tetratricopeptide repeat protein [cf. Phormidesmis sp. LEGE 11477]
MYQLFQKSVSALAIALSLSTVSAAVSGCSSSPQTAEGWHQQGIVQTQQSNLDKAIESFDKAVMLEAENTTMLVNRGLVRDELGDHQGAIEDYGRAIALEPTLVPAYYNRANSYHNLEKYEKSIADYSQAIDLEAGFAYAYVNRAINYEMLGDLEQATQDLNLALDTFKANEDRENIDRITAKLSELQS